MCLDRTHTLWGCLFPELSLQAIQQSGLLQNQRRYPILAYFQPLSCLLLDIIVGFDSQHMRNSNYRLKWQAELKANSK